MSENTSLHTEIQLKLAKLGRAVGCDVWVPSRDRDKQFMGEKLLTCSLKRLPPLGFASEAKSIIEDIDTIWLQENRVEAAFEIEHTTRIYSGLLRLSDLMAAVPNVSFPIFIVAPRERKEAVANQLRRPTFKKLRLDTKCKYISYEVLQDNYEKIEFAENPRVIGKIAVRPWELEKPAEIPVEVGTVFPVDPPPAIDCSLVHS